jgi:hypothetical protein
LDVKHRLHFLFDCQFKEVETPITRIVELLLRHLDQWYLRVADDVVRIELLISVTTNQLDDIEVLILCPRRTEHKVD